MPISKVLVANRGEIAVRIMRACADAGLRSVAVYADQDRDALHVRLADEAYALDGSSPAATYLAINKLVDLARRSDADAVHPGYGFLAENADFARACLDAGLIWIGPPPHAIESLGDKVRARHIAAKVGAPLVPGTAEPVDGVDEVTAFADEYGLPIAIKAAFGGGGRGLKVARTREEIPELFDSAVREATAAFGRGECFVERYLDRPRHVETQCLADRHGNVVVVSTRDCSLQRRHQKLVEEAPAPYLSEKQLKTLYKSSKAILRRSGLRRRRHLRVPGRPGRHDLLPRGQHPPAGRAPGHRGGLGDRPGPADVPDRERRALGFDDPPLRGTSIEFRINAEDPGRNFLPAPGTLTRWRPPSGPGVRVDAGYEEGETVPGEFDSLVAKLIVTGSTRAEAIERSRRALAEFEVGGMPTVIPFHRTVLTDPAFTAENGFGVHTRWIETEFAQSSELVPYTAGAAGVDGAAGRTRVTVEVGGKRLEVVIPDSIGSFAGSAAAAIASKRPGRRTGGSKAGAAPSGNALTSPMQGTIVKVAVADGDRVDEGDLVVVLEAMKMEQPITAHRAGTIGKLSADVGTTVPSGHVLAEILD